MEKNGTTVVYDAGLSGPKQGSNGSDLKQVPNGSMFEIILKSNLQGGYLWYFQGAKTGETWSFVQDWTEPLPRYGGTRQHFLFKATSTGVASLPFVYKRVWESHNYATFDMTIHIL